MDFVYPVVFRIYEDKVEFYCQYLEEVKGEYKTFEEAIRKAEVMVKLAVEGRYKHIPKTLIFLSQEDISKIKSSFDNEKIVLISAKPKIKFVRKTITIPYELDNCVKEKKINLSGFVQKALYKECSRK